MILKNQNQKRRTRKILKFLENHRQKMSVRLNVRMSKIMRMPIKVGVRTSRFMLKVGVKVGVRIMRTPIVEPCPFNYYIHQKHKNIH